MNYAKQGFQSGDILYAAQLNSMDDQIADNAEAIDSIYSAILFPEQFGAKGDGQTDDTSALSTVFNRSNAVIEGSNRAYKLGELVVSAAKNLIISNFRFFHGVCITLKQCENITFRNCTWDEFQDGGVADRNVQCVVLTTTHTGNGQ